jgi:H+/Cl- antiporter ClcA
VSATIQVKYSTADWNAAGNDPDRLKLAYYSGGKWNLLVTTVGTASGTVSAQTNHLSDWAVLAKEAGSAWQWWYTLLIVMGVLVIVAVVVLFVITRRRGASEDFDDDDLYIDDDEEF